MYCALMTCAVGILDVWINDKASYVNKGQAAKGFVSGKDSCKYEIKFNSLNMVTLSATSTLPPITALISIT